MAEVIIRKALVKGRNILEIECPWDKKLSGSALVHLNTAPAARCIAGTVPVCTMSPVFQENGEQ